MDTMNPQAKPAPVAFGRVCILGMGKSGDAAAHWCLRQLQVGTGAVSDLLIYAGKTSPSTLGSAKPFQEAGIPVIFDEQHVQGSFDTCIVSPGISNLSDFYRSAQQASAQIMSEPEAAYRISPDDWVVITGTNGKTTTTALCAHLLRSGGLLARAVGNIGDTCIAAVDDRAPGEFFVAELSSYQLASTSRLAPKAAVLLNITPDHLSWHGSHLAYMDAKLKAFDNMEPDSLAIIDYTTADARLCAMKLERRDIRVFPIDATAVFAPRPGAGVESGELVINLPGHDTLRLCRVDELLIKGEHNVVNALAAASAALWCGADPAGVAQGLGDFQPLEHRIEPCGSYRGVDFYNDSKGTNVDATLKAVTSFPGKRVHVLLGGRDKGTDLQELVDTCKSCCATVTCYGESRERFLAAFADCGIPVLQAGGMADALQVALTQAKAGDVVLLSPACASFDEFTGYEQRGEIFKELVAKLAEGNR